MESVRYQLSKINSEFVGLVDSNKRRVVISLCNAPLFKEIWLVSREMLIRVDVGSSISLD